METSFGVLPNNITQISKWRQLLNLKSSIQHIKCRVTNVDDSICEGTSITIYNDETNFVYVTFFVSGSDSCEVPVSEIALTSAEAVSILNNFGYSIAFVPITTLTTNTIALLTSYKNLGFNYIFRDVFGHVFVSENLAQSVEDMDGVSIEDSPLFSSTQFSFLDKLTAYNITSLLNAQ